VDAAARETGDVNADGEVVWSCRLAISSPWEKLKKPRPVKDLYGLPGAGPGLAEPRRALLGPGFTPSALGRELGLRPARLDPVGLRLGGLWPPVLWRGSRPGVL
jgi:hypothetical protein